MSFHSRLHVLDLSGEHWKVIRCCTKRLQQQQRCPRCFSMYSGRLKVERRSKAAKVWRTSHPFFCTMGAPYWCSSFCRHPITATPRVVAAGASRARTLSNAQMRQCRQQQVLDRLEKSSHEHEHERQRSSRQTFAMLAQRQRQPLQASKAGYASHWLKSRRLFADLDLPASNISLITSRRTFEETEY